MQQDNYQSYAYYQAPNQESQITNQPPDPQSYLYQAPLTIPQENNQNQSSINHGVNYYSVNQIPQNALIHQNFNGAQQINQNQATAYRQTNIQVTEGAADSSTYVQAKSDKLSVNNPIINEERFEGQQLLSRQIEQSIDAPQTHPQNHKNVPQSLLYQSQKLISQIKKINQSKKLKEEKKEHHDYPNDQSEETKMADNSATNDGNKKSRNRKKITYKHIEKFAKELRQLQHGTSHAVKPWFNYELNDQIVRVKPSSYVENDYVAQKQYVDPYTKSASIERTINYDQYRSYLRQNEDQRFIKEWTFDDQVYTQRIQLADYLKKLNSAALQSSSKSLNQKGHLNTSNKKLALAVKPSDIQTLENQTLNSSNHKSRKRQKVSNLSRTQSVISQQEVSQDASATDMILSNQNVPLLKQPGASNSDEPSSFIQQSSKIVPPHQQQAKQYQKLSFSPRDQTIYRKIDEGNVKQQVEILPNGGMGSAPHKLKHQFSQGQDIQQQQQQQVPIFPRRENGEKMQLSYSKKTSFDDDVATTQLPYVQAQMQSGNQPSMGRGMPQMYSNSPHSSQMKNYQNHMIAAPYHTMSAPLISHPDNSIDKVDSMNALDLHSNVSTDQNAMSDKHSFSQPSNKIQKSYYGSGAPSRSHHNNLYVPSSSDTENMSSQKMMANQEMRQSGDETERKQFNQGSASQYGGGAISNHSGSYGMISQQKPINKYHTSKFTDDEKDDGYEGYSISHGTDGDPTIVQNSSIMSSTSNIGNSLYEKSSYNQQYHNQNIDQQRLADQRGGMSHHCGSNAAQQNSFLTPYPVHYQSLHQTHYPSQPNLQIPQSQSQMYPHKAYQRSGQNAQIYSQQNQSNNMMTNDILYGQQQHQTISNNHSSNASHLNSFNSSSASPSPIDHSSQLLNKVSDTSVALTGQPSFDSSRQTSPKIQQQHQHQVQSQHKQKAMSLYSDSSYAPNLANIQLPHQTNDQQQQYQYRGVWPSSNASGYNPSQQQSQPIPSSDYMIPPSSQSIPQLPSSSQQMPTNFPQSQQFQQQYKQHQKELYYQQMMKQQQQYYMQQQQQQQQQQNSLNGMSNVQHANQTQIMDESNYLKQSTGGAAENGKKQ